MNKSRAKTSAKTTALAACLTSLSLIMPSVVSANTSADNWVSGSGTAWKSSDGLCWRSASWTPATASKECDGAIVQAAPVPVPVVPPAPAVVAPAPKPAPAPVPVAPVSQKVTYEATALFDFDKSNLKKEAKAQLDDLVSKSKNAAIEVVIAVGHADSTGGDDYNQKLSLRRADTVKAYLVEKGIDQARVYTEGKGEKQPVADNKTSDGRSKNRRVDVEFVGSQKR
jgi:OOP family OmpA-OmpF porin